MSRLAGIDGCRGGWVVVHAEDGVPADARVDVIIDLPLDLSTLGVAAALIDVPIGLTGEGVVRKVDAAARAALPGKASSVFSAPARATLAARHYAEALAINRHETGRGLSLQAFHITPKIAEVDEVLASDKPPVLAEGHPEVSFALATGGPLPHPKRRAAGRAERARALEALGFPPADVLIAQARRPGAPCRAQADDVLDAAILLWSAVRWQAGHHQSFPEHSGRDARGRTMAIHA